MEVGRKGVAEETDSQPPITRLRIPSRLPKPDKLLGYDVVVSGPDGVVYEGLGPDES